MPQTELRISGSGFTTFNYRGKSLAWCDQISDSGQAPVGDPSPVVAVTPIGWTRPREIATTRVVGAGTLTLSLRETWNANVWNQLAGLENVARAGTITDIYKALADDPALVTCTKIIRPPGNGLYRVVNYMNCVIVAIDDGETITAGGMTVAKGIQVMYTHKVPSTAAPTA